VLDACAVFGNNRGACNAAMEGTPPTEEEVKEVLDFEERAPALLRKHTKDLHSVSELVDRMSGIDIRNKRDHVTFIKGLTKLSDEIDAQSALMHQVTLDLRAHYPL